MNKIRPIHRLTLLAAALSITCIAPGSTAAAASLQDDRTVENWAEQVWQSALRGDRISLEEKLHHVPADGATEIDTERYRASLELREENQRVAESEQAEARERAYGELKEHLEAGELSQALRSAVEVQTLSDDFDAAFDDPAIDEVIRWAEREIPDVKAEGDWLLAQELLFRLRTLFDDTSRYEDYKRYDELLEQVNRRVALLSRYAPRTLHELRVRSAERLGEEPLGEFNSSNVVDIDERLEDINAPMLRQSLRTAASEHIESEGWRPLFVGGLEALRLVGTTELLSETYPRLSNANRVQAWEDFINQELEDLEAMPDDNLDAWEMNNLLERIEETNAQTIELPMSLVLREFGDGAMHRLDRFSEIIWPDNLRRFRQATEGNFIGVGILIRHNDKREIVVINPLEGTPAYFAGIKPEDVIAEVDGESTVGWSLNDAVDEITGPEGESVTLGIKREGEQELLSFEIERDTIKMLSVKGWWKKDMTDDGEPVWDWFVDDDSRIAYVRLTSFNEDSYHDLRQAWREINEDGNVNGLIFDLRYNPGGLLTSAVQISNMFLRSGVIVSGENKDGVRAWPDQRARRTMAELADIPTVVLINKGSASGSEIVAGALQAHGAAVIVGERTFGKGSVQTVHQVAANAALKLTTQYYRLPAAEGEEKGRLVHRRPGATTWGVDPDITVNMTPSQFEQWYQVRQQADILPEDFNSEDETERPDINDLLTKGLDPQLETALLILQARALGTAAAQERHAARD